MSGVVITAGDEHKPVRLLDGAKVYFCCEACAKHFDENAEKIRLARGL
jgi:YHS domain-containing protein